MHVQCFNFQLNEYLVFNPRGGMRFFTVVIIILATEFGGQIVGFEQAIEDKDIPEERLGDDSSGEETFLEIKF